MSHQGKRQRRAVLVAAALAGLAGLGVGAWRFRLSDVDELASQGLWGLAFEQPQSAQALRMRDFYGQRLLLNFWATWCPPCVEEMPLLDSFYREKAANGWQVVGLAIDQPTAVRAFLQRVPVSFPIGLAGVAGSDLGRDLGNLSGGLPFTVVFGRDGAVVQRKMGQVTPADLAQWHAAVSP
jgi:thiol-disulfide isomerase/thioredoxin